MYGDNLLVGGCYTARSLRNLLATVWLRDATGTIALDFESKRDWVEIPSGAIVEVTGGLHGPGNRLTELLWGGRKVTVFATDLKASMEI